MVEEKASFETTQLAAADLDTVGITIIADLLLGDPVLFRDREGFRAGDRLLNSRRLECLCNFICVHGNNVLCTSS